MYIAAGEIIEHITGFTWDEYIKQTFFEPLKMKNSNSSLKEMEKKKNKAYPHTGNLEEIIPISYLNWDNIGAAGAINSSASDMIQWIKLHLNEGSLNGNEFFSKIQLHQIWSPQTIQYLPSGGLFPSTHFKAYGYGWSMFDYLGKKVIGHSGGYDGIISYMGLVPEINLGFIILTNKNSALYYALSYKILDEFLGAEDHDWSNEILNRIKQNEHAEKENLLKEAKLQVLNTQPTLDINEYTGKYLSEMYGEAEVKLNHEGELVLALLPSPLFIGKLTHWHFNTFQIEMTNFPSLPKGKVVFYINENGKVNRLQIDIPNPDFDFKELEFNKL